jgi:hypothetical protein
MKNLPRNFNHVFVISTTSNWHFSYCVILFTLILQIQAKKSSSFFLWTNARLKMIILLSMGHLKAWQNSLATEIWKYILTDKDLPTFKSGISKLLSMFGSKWVCESTITTMGFIKSKYRCQIDYVHLEGELRCALSSDIQPTFLQLVRQKIAKFRIKCSIFFNCTILFRYQNLHFMYKYTVNATLHTSFMKKV